MDCDRGRRHWKIVVSLAVILLTVIITVVSVSLYNGTQGICDDNNKNKDNFLDVNNNKNDISPHEEKYVPVPRFFWKVLHDKYSNTAVVFLGLNDPHESQAPLELCPNRCAEMAWVDWEMTDLDGGYMYCCDLQEAAAVLPEVGSLRLSSSGLLQANGPPVTPATTTQPLPSDLCRVNLEELTGKYPPILLQNDRFVFPTSEDADGSRYLNFESGSELDLYCHGSEKNQAKTTVLTEGKDTSLVRLSLVCRNQQFVHIITEEVVNVEAASCKRRQEPRLIRSQEECSIVGADGRRKGLSDLVRVSIGWQLGEVYREQIGLCHDEKTFSTIWTNYTLQGASIDFRDKDSGRPKFRIDTSYNKRFFTWATSTKMNTYYSKKNQKSTVKKILGSNTIDGTTIIETGASGTNYFAKGHLSPDAGFVYNVMQDATYYFLNVAPQFQSFNNGNWKSLEYAVRDLGMKLGREIQVYTGTHGTLKYKDTNNNYQKIFLHQGYVPAPRYYWKVLQDQTTDTATVFIGLNDPHVTRTPTELCTNKCAEMAWVDWEMTDLDGGYMYCCDLQEAAAVFPEISSLDMKASGLIQIADQLP